MDEHKIFLVCIDSQGQIVHRAQVCSVPHKELAKPFLVMLIDKLTGKEVSAPVMAKPEPPPDPLAPGTLLQ